MFNPIIKFVVFDFDGTFTEGKFHIDSNGVETKVYNGKDSYAIKILNDLGIKTALLTSHDSPVFDHLLKINHFNKLDFFDKGSQNKIEILDLWRKNLNLSWSQIAYTGDDLNDYDCMKRVGFAACPIDAVDEIKQLSHYQSKLAGGKGAVRDFVNYMVKQGYTFFKKYRKNLAELL